MNDKNTTSFYQEQSNYLRLTGSILLLKYTSNREIGLHRGLIYRLTSGKGLQKNPTLVFN